jgi:hypothetical protein
MAVSSLKADRFSRLSRPALATQHPLPDSHELGISPKASLAYPSENNTNDKSILSPVLNLPEAFGSAYVGETFSCTLCANNELLPSDASKVISGVKIQGDMQTPSNPTGSPLELASTEAEADGSTSPAPGESLQRILRFELKEEGNHVLAVTVTYTETALGEGKAASGRVRTFRKLYQFVAQQLLSVRTKAGELSQSNGVGRYLLEAQLENMGEAAVCLEVCLVTLDAVPTMRLVWSFDSSCILSMRSCTPHTHRLDTLVLFTRRCPDVSRMSLSCMTWRERNRQLSAQGLEMMM